jgi:2-polyprenyl-6-methoxyphenol hydroxylase-like FAD-dependent oxidoreductase
MRRAIVVGGSLGGLFAACMLLRSGWDVAVIERAEGRLAGRGAGLGVHPSMLEGLLHAGAHVDASVGIALGGRAVLARDGSIAAEIAMPQFCTSWARLYSLLSDVCPDERVRRGVA